MATVFNQVFSCCLQRKSSRALVIEPEERRLLIPATTEPPPIRPPNVSAVDQERLKERLSSIVRSKEGKMVNVNAQLPFNLHNKKISVIMDPSSSRSASTSTHRPSLNFSPLPSTPHSHTQFQAYVGAPLTSPSPHADLSRSSSMASRETSGNESEANHHPNRTIFNLRLVRNIPVGGTARRGRSRTRATDTTENFQERPEDLATTTESQTHQSLPSQNLDTQTPRGPNIPCLEDPHPKLSISPASSIEFTLTDPGPLTVNWED